MATLKIDLKLVMIPPEIKEGYFTKLIKYHYSIQGALNNDLTSLEQRVKQLGDKANQEVKNTLSRVEPKLKELQKAYTDELQKLYSEIANDKTLKEISEGL